MSARIVDRRVKSTCNLYSIAYKKKFRDRIISKPALVNLKQNEKKTTLSNLSPSFLWNRTH